MSIMDAEKVVQYRIDEGIRLLQEMEKAVSYLQLAIQQAIEHMTVSIVVQVPTTGAIAEFGAGNGHSTADDMQIEEAPVQTVQRAARAFQTRQGPRVEYVLSAPSKGVVDMKGVTPVGHSIIEYVHNHKRATMPEIVKALKISKSTAGNVVMDLRRRKLLESRPAGVPQGK